MESVISQGSLRARSELSLVRELFVATCLTSASSRAPAFFMSMTNLPDTSKLLALHPFALYH